MPGREYDPQINGQPFQTSDHVRHEALLQVELDRPPFPSECPASCADNQVTIISREMVDWRKKVTESVRERRLVQYGNDPIIARAIAEDSEAFHQLEAQRARDTQVKVDSYIDELDRRART